MILLLLGQCRIPQDTRLLGRPLQQAPKQVIDVPARHDDQQAGVFRQPRAEFVGEPRPGLIANQFRIRLGPPFKRVIDNTEIEGEPSDATFNGDIAK